jgi:hypothetical protein
MDTPDTSTPSTTRPLGYWVRAVHRLISFEFATVFADEGISGRDWRLLNHIDAGPLPAGRTPRGPRLRVLQAHGWIEHGSDGWTLTTDGRLAKERIGAAVDQIRARITDAVSPEDYATMTASLEKVASEFGWQEGQKLPRRGRRGFGPFGAGFGPGGFRRGFGPDRGHYSDHDSSHPHREGRGHGHSHEHGHSGHHNDDGHHSDDGHHGHRRGFGPRGFGRGRRAFLADGRHPYSDATCGRRADEPR